MRILFPDIKPYSTFRFAADTLHTLHVEECGNPNGLPALFLHGGPGAGCEPMHRRFFDPERYRIVLFDQRGAGQSTPHAELRDNTLQHLITDIERLRERLGIDRWVVFGGSWGSTLALAYAETHPERVLGLIVRGIFLCREQDIQWFYQEGANRLFPDLWEHFLAPIPALERDDLLHAYHRRLTSANELERLRAAKAWSVWEGSTLTLESNPSVVDRFGEARLALSLARIECHYFVNQCFMEPNQLLRDAGRLSGIPGVIVHGRYDVVCPLDNAWALHQAWPEAELRIVTPAGHAASEPGIVDALITATQSFADRFA
ncbi:MAG: prolyl aminopeptidase [Candidatus Competibacteraceae bacterium]|nr:prolyl aminopeptidase [Candidatus Competibacteraceae bacterium]